LVYKAYQASFNTAEHLDLRDFLPDTQEIGRGAIVGQPGADQQLEANKQMFFLESAILRAQVLRSSTPRFSVPAITD